MKAIFSLVLGLVMTISLGCDGGASDLPDLGTVTGTVTVDGKPAADLTVGFAPEGGGRPSTGTTDAQGKYELMYNATNMGAKVGKHSVSLSFVREYTEEELADPNITLKKPEGDVSQKIAGWSQQVEVKAGSNTIDLAVTSAPK